MILIGLINLAIGFCSYDPAPAKTEKIQLELPTVYWDAAVPAPDAATAAPPDAAATPPR